LLSSAGYLLLKAGTHFHAVVDDALDGLGLNGRQLLVLTFTSGEEHLSQQMLSVRMGLDPTIIVALVDDLEGRGLVVRERDPEDRRRHRLRTTGKGRKVHAAAVKAVTVAEREFLAPLDRSERERLRALLVEVMTPRLPWMGSGTDVDP
jgi:DNA-binding MarR family transcriptional regulator